MYAVIRTGGKQYRVEHGATVEIERLDAAEGAELALTPVLVVDGETVLATPSQLGDATVKVKVLAATKGPKIDGFTYKNKTNNRRRWGHRQRHTLVEVTSIAAGGKTSKPPTPERAEQPAKTAAKKPAKASAKDSAAKASTAKKPAKSTAKKATAKQPTAKKAAAKKATKATTKKPATKKSAEKRAKKDES